jgi:tetratricopeptide (TPR) repeat protein
MLLHSLLRTERLVDDLIPVRSEPVRVKHDRVVVDAMAAVNDDPSKAIRLANSVIDAADASDEERIKARWARGMARRERGEMALGADDLFAARQDAVAQHDSVLAARIDTTLAAVALYTGSADGAFEILDQAEPHLRGADLARLETQRGLILHRSGALRDASTQYLSALRHFQEGRDDVGLARLLLNLGILHAERGELAKSVNRLVRAADVAAGAGQRLMAAGARHNRGYARSRAGRFSAALDDLQTAEVEYRALGRTDYAAVAQADRAAVLVHCNLVEEACLTADLAAAGLHAHGNETEFADAELLAARCRLAAGRLEAARAAAAESSASFRRQHRSAWEAMADYVETEIVARDEPTAATAQAMDDVSRRLEEFGWSTEAATARVRAGQLFLGVGQVDRAAAVLSGLRVAADRPAGERTAAYLARGLLADARGDRRRARAAVRSGLRVVTDNQTSLDTLEFRTFAAGHGEALVELGSRLAISDHRPSELLDRVEATRRTVWLAPRATPPSDDVLADLLAQLRAVTEDLRAAVGGGSDPADAWSSSGRCATTRGGGEPAVTS